jgi:hypothetical protein
MAMVVVTSDVTMSGIDVALASALRSAGLGRDAGNWVTVVRNEVSGATAFVDLDGEPGWEDAAWQ